MNVRKQNFITSLAARARRMRQLAAEKPKPAQVKAALDFYRPAKENRIENDNLFEITGTTNKPVLKVAK
jgi:hypothetical protein